MSVVQNAPQMLQNVPQTHCMPFLQCLYYITGSTCTWLLISESWCGAAQVWAVPPKEMQCEWLGERVATVDVDRAIKNVIHNKEDAGWGPNAVFRFPLEGGTGGIWKGVARLLPQDKQVSLLPSWLRCYGVFASEQLTQKPSDAA